MRRKYGKHKRTFLEVLWNDEDQVTVRQLLDELVPEGVKSEVVSRFNQSRDDYNEWLRQTKKEGREARQRRK